MRATVFRVAVASLVAACCASAQESPTRAASAGQSRVASGPDSVSAAGRVADTLGFGGREVASRDTVAGPVVVALGDLHVAGTILGTAVAIAGDILVEPGGRISGDAIAAFGTVHAPAGTVGGQARSLSSTLFSSPAPSPAVPKSRESLSDAVGLSLGWLVMVLVVGIGVLVFASSYLEGVTDVLEQSFWRSFLIGIVGEIAVLPALLLLLVALAVTVVGLLLIPFAIVAYVVAVAGLGTLGFLATANLTGGSIGARRAGGLHARGKALRALVLGIALYLGMWVVAALFQWSPVVSGALRALALAITYAGVTAGFGAAILSRGGTRRDAAKRRAPSDEMAVWQTPTPVTGVVAARRPTPASVPK